MMERQGAAARVSWNGGACGGVEEQSRYWIAGRNRNSSAIP
jgi:hypothetical protein